MNQPAPLESFYPQLAQDSAVQATLKSRFAERAPSILQHLENGTDLCDAADPVSDLLEALVKDECDEVDTFYGNGSDGYFPITISNAEEKRVSAAMGYLDAETRKRPNLTISTNTQVSEVLCGGCVVGPIVLIDEQNPVRPGA